MMLIIPASHIIVSEETDDRFKQYTYTYTYDYVMNDLSGILYK